MFCFSTIRLLQGLDNEVALHESKAGFGDSRYTMFSR